MERRYIIKNLGYYRGVNLQDYKEIFNKDIISEYSMFDKLYTDNLVEIENNFLKLTKLGLKYSDVILPMWISKAVKMRMNK